MKMEQWEIVELFKEEGLIRVDSENNIISRCEMEEEITLEFYNILDKITSKFEKLKVCQENNLKGKNQLSYKNKMERITP